MKEQRTQTWSNAGEVRKHGLTEGRRRGYDEGLGESTLLHRKSYRHSSPNFWTREGTATALINTRFNSFRRLVVQSAGVVLVGSSSRWCRSTGKQQEVDYTTAVPLRCLQYITAGSSHRILTAFSERITFIPLTVQASRLQLGQR